MGRRVAAPSIPPWTRPWTMCVYATDRGDAAPRCKCRASVCVVCCSCCYLAMIRQRAGVCRRVSSSVLSPESRAERFSQRQHPSKHARCHVVLRLVHMLVHIHSYYALFTSGVGGFHNTNESTNLWWCRFGRCSAGHYSIRHYSYNDLCIV